MPKSLVMALICAVLLPAPALGAEKHKKAESKKKQKVEAGASCRAPAVGTCAACNIVCRAGETAICAPGVVFTDVCHPQPSCRCTK